MQSSNKLYFRVLFWARKNKKLKINIYFNYSPTLPISLVLSVHKNHSIDLQSKSLQWFLHNGNTANSRRHLFQILILNWLKTFLTTFPNFNLARLISQKPLKNYQILDDEYSNHISIPLLSILISSKQQLKPKIQHMLPYPKDIAIKYLKIRTEPCKVILPGWYFWLKQHIFPHMICLLPTLLPLGYFADTNHVLKHKKP